MGFKEIQHTADVALEVWAAEPVGLFAEAALGFNWISGADIAHTPRSNRSIALEAEDLESLLVAFLTELVYAQEQDDLGFDEFRLQIDDHGLKGQMQGGRLLSLAKPIKAVTYHNIHISQSDRGYEVRIVFDV